jgi:hypothetical protein
MAVPADADLVDPLQVASDALEDVAEAHHANGPSAPSDPQPDAPDPLAVLSRSLEEAGVRVPTPDLPRRGLLGRRGRGRPAAGPVSSEATPRVVGSGEAPAAQRPQEPSVASVPDEPRVTTWAEDFEHASATGEWPAVASDPSDTRADVEETVTTTSAAGRPQAGRRRPRKGAVRDVVAEVVQAGRDPRPDEHVDTAEDQPAATQPAGWPERSQIAPEDAERARLVSVREAAQRQEEDRLAALKGEEDRRRAGQAEVQRLAAEQAEADRIEADRAAAQQAEDDRLEQLRLATTAAEERPLATEQAEAERAAAERAEVQRLAAEQAEADRIEADRAAAQQAEDDRLEQLRLATSAAEEHRLASADAQVEQARQEAAAAEADAQERAAAEQAEAQRLEQERLDGEKAATERAEQAERQRQAAASARADAASARAAGRRTPATVAAGGAEPLPRFIEFRSTSVLRYVFGAVFVVCAVAAVIAIFRAVSGGSSDVILAAAGLTALAMLSWWALLGWTPPIVSVSNGLLEVSRGAKSVSWDLRDPATEITFRGRPSSRSWRAVLRSPTGKPTAISARQVDPALFVEVVEHYQGLGPEVQA